MLAERWIVFDRRHRGGMPALSRLKSMIAAYAYARAPVQMVMLPQFRPATPVRC